MPVILEAKDFEQRGQGDTKDAAALMKPADEDTLQRWPVLKRVNSSKAPDDDPTLIEPQNGSLHFYAILQNSRSN
jgi:putative SOS response-associated peptidase YedK